MNLEDQVCSLELAKRLKELGVKQESLFCYTTDYDLEFLQPEIRNYDVCIAAFTVSELGIFLKKDIIQHKRIKGRSHMTVYLNCGLNLIELIGSSPAGFSERSEVIFSTSESSEANARAKMLICLLENGLIENDRS